MKNLKKRPKNYCLIPFYSRMRYGPAINGVDNWGVVKSPGAIKSSWVVRSSELTHVLGRTTLYSGRTACPLQDNSPWRLYGVWTDWPTICRYSTVGTSGDDSKTPSANLVSCGSRTSAATPDNESVMWVRLLDRSRILWVCSTGILLVGYGR